MDSNISEQNLLTKVEIKSNPCQKNKKLPKLNFNKETFLTNTNKAPKLKKKRYKLTDFGISFDSRHGCVVDFGMDKFLAPELFGSSLSNEMVNQIDKSNLRSISENSMYMLWL